MANHIEADITIETPDGVSVPIKFALQWPENMGYYAIPAINKLGGHADEFTDAIIQQLVANGDTSLLAHLPDEDED